MNNSPIFLDALSNLMRGGDVEPIKRSAVAPARNNNNPVPLQYYNPMTQVNPFYTQVQPFDALAPMAMYQQFKQTGQLPQAQSSFMPWSAPQAPVSPDVPPATGVKPSIGGK